MTESEVFLAAVRTAFSELKETADEHELELRRLPFTDGSGWLVPVCELHAEDWELIELIGAWRTRFMDVFPTQFTVTSEGTHSWLRHQVLDAADRVMFLAVERDGTIVGHCGFAEPEAAGVLKLDNVVRGGPRSVMAVALPALFAWAGELGARRLRAPIMSTNTAALGFFTRLGATVSGRQPLRRHVEGDRVLYLPVTDGDTAEPDRYHIQISFELPSP